MKQKLTAEFLGTYILIFVGTGAIIVESLTGALSHLGVGLVFGMAVVFLIYTFGHISGAHMNPAVTLAFYSAKEIELKQTIFFILAQTSGALLASSTLFLLFFQDVPQLKEIAYLGATLPRGSTLQSFIFEFILTFILMLVINLSAVHAKAIKPFAAIAIGFTVGVEAIFAGPICGASMNPARSLAPALISLHLDHLWIYLTAPFLGALLSVFVYNYLKNTSQKGAPMKNILVLCTGNSCRSIIAEALLNAHLGECVNAYSAGVSAKGAVNPESIKVLKAHNIWKESYYSKDIDAIIDIDFDLVVTVCDHAKETCPMFPKPVEKIHVGFEDPDGDAYEAYEKTYALIKKELLPVIKERLC